VQDDLSIFEQVEFPPFLTSTAPAPPQQLLTLAQGVVSGSIIDAVLCPNVPQLYYVRVNGNASFSLMVPPIQPIHLIKNAIASSIGVSSSQLHITAYGRRLDAQHSLLNLGIESGAWLDCVVVPSSFGAATLPRVNAGLAVPRALAHATAAQQLAMQRVYGEDVGKPTESHPQTSVIID
jgi:hypothetical protein